MFAYGGSATVTAGHMKFSQNFTLKTYHFLFEWQLKKKKKIQNTPAQPESKQEGEEGN